MICTLYGGRVAEDIIFGKVTSGAQDDLKRVHQIAFSAVSQLGMSDKVGRLGYDFGEGYQKPFSEQTGSVYIYINIYIYIYCS